MFTIPQQHTDENQPAQRRNAQKGTDGAPPLRKGLSARSARPLGDVTNNKAVHSSSLGPKNAGPTNQTMQGRARPKLGDITNKAPPPVESYHPCKPTEAALFDCTGFDPAASVQAACGMLAPVFCSNSPPVEVDMEMEEPPSPQLPFFA